MKSSTRTPTDERLRDLLLWLRKERIICTEITVGDVSLTLNDMALAHALTAPTAGKLADPTESDVRNLYAEYGGKAIDEAAKEEQTTYEDDD